MQWVGNETPLVRLEFLDNRDRSVEVWMKREDLVHSHVSGNKWHKLKYNVDKAIELGYDKVLTYGGAYSNHIAATAAAGKLVGLNTIGVIRGEEHLPLNPTLSYAKSCGMKFHYMDRSIYRRKKEEAIKEQLVSVWGKYYEIPEGGSNELAVKGCAEILDGLNEDFDVIACAVGTGGTVAGLAVGARGNVRVVGVSALKGAHYLNDEVETLLERYQRLFGQENLSRWEVRHDFSRGGYAKVDEELIDFVNYFYNESGIALDVVYTGKLLMAVKEMISLGEFDNQRVLVIHTGGLQGNAGMRDRLGLKVQG